MNQLSMPEPVSTLLAQVNSAQEEDTGNSSSSGLPAELQNLVGDLAAVSAESDAVSTPSESPSSDPFEFDPSVIAE